jgi:hypothetical protein
MQRKLKWSKFQSQLDCFDLKMKIGIIQEATFIHLDPGNAKQINFKKMNQKTMK